MDLSHSKSDELGSAPNNMTWALHWSEVAVLDSNSEALGVSQWELMQSAAEQLAEQVKKMLPRGGSVLFLCGPGNNGGDGYLAAANLIDESMSESVKYDVCVLASHESQKESSEISIRAREWAIASGVHITSWYSNFVDSSGCAPNSRTISAFHPELIVDALLGSGVGSFGAELRGNIDEIVSWLIEQHWYPKCMKLACDIPTGIGTNSCLVADSTITFHAPKLEMMDNKAKPRSEIGELIVAPLPWPEESLKPGPGDLKRYTPLDPHAVKGDRGRLLIVGGGPYHGAPILSALGALRIGCDLVHVAMPSLAAQRVEWPVDVICEEIPDVGLLSLVSLDAIEERMTSGRGIQALLIGPGLGKVESTKSAVECILGLCIKYKIPVVIDADAISALPKDAWPLGLVGVVTPHAKELASWLITKNTDQLIESIVNENGWFANSSKSENFCLIKTGYVDELTGLHNRKVSLEGGNPRMSVGGTGDVLAGIIAGLLASGVKPWPAARIGSYLLRVAGEDAGKELGPGMLAKDVPIYVSKLISKLI